ncbi:Adaptor protein complex AP-1 gamma subunit [Saitoella complicata NRRL Y-17804]|uniref:AP-1 complex subunit gamma n=1 Tax=Saitoella complicata (strain BCRC 22490 / CBS 7301 / JCM 7358 / NBRC 10748 / NRRL Y-17804) TaxID=698492 RepID=A0A0E9NES8_SAICN|nr:Adaptor protein complex AP-1 gamma subunit [Saitoella complicata NRRL Y-17804]ODQ50860.1 Adaptor protein complex AP-1 gamma subunit [Saitoella complicata NRRL Y-17804]GAO48354.1 hypothetical protein G7K_2527-t1 [Saitoella complicata NRRL Y-17804]
MSTVSTFIKKVRACKTAADERALLQKESAAIRTSFREEPTNYDVRRNNIAKLLYLFTMGERTHFGQIECLKLLASPKFADKRLGYLGTMLLLDESQEVLTLLTNSLQNDLKHTNQYIVGLALATFGNISSPEMSRDLCQDLEKCLSSSNAYIRKKAALCAMRVIRKVPELQDNFVDRAKTLLSDRNHGVLLCGVTFATDLCENDPDLVDQFKSFTPILLRQLKALLGAGYSPEHDVTGITDPFLQVKILQFLGVLGRGDTEVSEQMNDILAQVATNTEASKNVGNAILYQSVLTILEIEADSALRVLGINNLGKFLTNKDNNIRYVALNTLSKVVAIEPNAVQRHRNTILDCLRDPDVSIRRRALDLSFALINESNIRVLVRELLAFLEVANNEFKANMTSQICLAADRYAPNKRWHIDTVLRVLKLAGNYVKEQILSSFIRLVGTTPELQQYAAQKLYASLQADISQEGLILAGAWIIGEFGDALLKGGNFEEEELVREVKESNVIDLFETILNSTFANQLVTEYVLTAAMKLTTRITDPTQISRIRAMLAKHSGSLDVEIQQRAVEYNNLFQYDSIRQGVLERMPPPAVREDPMRLGAPKVDDAKSKRKPKKESALLDLMGGDDLEVAPANGAPAAQTNNADLLSDIFGSTGGETAAPSQPAQSSVNDIMSLFGSNGGAPAAASSAMDLLGMGGAPAPAAPIAVPAAGPAASTFEPITAYSNHDLLVTLQAHRDASFPPGVVNVMARFHNQSFTTRVDHLNFQAAVPKSQKLQMQPLSAPGVAPGAQETQAMRVTSTQGAQIRLRLKVTFTREGEAEVSDQVDFKFPADILA